MVTRRTIDPNFGAARQCRVTDEPTVIDAVRIFVNESEDAGRFGDVRLFSVVASQGGVGPGGVPALNRIHPSIHRHAANGWRSCGGTRGYGGSAIGWAFVQRQIFCVRKE